uniref:GRAM domain containing 1C n=1 Tax=Salvator merianae TaxID=96440 RepID=A0A8D0BJ29_SALMN
MENIYLSSEENGQLRSSLCDESGEKQQPREDGVIQEPVTQIPEIETESLNGSTLTEETLLEESNHGKQDRRNSFFASRKKSADVAQHTSLIQSPDLNENFPREKSSASESDREVEETIPENDFHGKLFINREFRISADRMFEMLFTNSHFMQRYQSARNITDAVSTLWNRDIEGNQFRTMTYTIMLNNPLIGKFTTATEKQVLHKRRRKEQSYRIDTEVVTHDVPYHDYFYTVSHFSVIHISSQKCRLRISSDVKYKKQPWGLIKNMIEKNTWGGIQENFKQLESELLMEEYEINKPLEDPAKLGVLRRRRWALQRNAGEILPKRPFPCPSGDSGLPSRGDGGPKRDAANKTITIIVIMSIVLLLLLLLNVTLFLKLSKIEHAAQSFYRVHIQKEGSVNLDFSVASREKNPRHNADQVQHVKGVLRDSIALLEQLKSSLSMLQSSFDHLNKTKTKV